MLINLVAFDGFFLPFLSHLSCSLYRLSSLSRVAKTMSFSKNYSFIFLAWVIFDLIALNHRFTKSTNLSWLIVEEQYCFTKH